MKLTVVGVNHKDTPVMMREKASFTTRGVREVEEYLMLHDIPEVLVLSTCNRSEIYVISSDTDLAEKKVKDFYIHKKALELSDYLFVKKDREAIQHLYRVVTGLNSLILGEDQILGQVKEALARAQENGSAKKFMSKIFREAITFAKEVKTTYKISENPLSLSSVAVKYITQQIEDIHSKNILVIGTGKMGLLALKYIEEAGFSNTYITNRSRHRVVKVADGYPFAEIVNFEDRYKILEKVDVVISATASPHVILKAEEIIDIKNPVMMVDIAMPRDIEDSIGKIDGINLHTIDDLNNVIDESKAYRLKIAGKIENEIESQIEEILLWIKKAKVDPMIECFNLISRSAADEAIEQIAYKLKLEGKEKKYVEKVIHSKMRQVVINPIKQLKQLEDAQEIANFEKTVSYLFDYDLNHKG
jgi:glutamyl-tRNA reductase